MKVISLNVGLPREIAWNGKTVRTGIFKEPVPGRLRLRKLNFEGDQQADLTVHGGADKAVYAYPAEHYEYWRRELPDMELHWGMFGENLTTEGLLEESVRIGDRFRIGSAEIVATQPRLPCYKLGIKFGRADMVKRFAASLRTGFYFAVEKEGEVGAGDAIEPVGQDESSLTVSDIARLYLFRKDDREAIARAVALESLPANWRNYFREQLSRLPD